MSSSSQSSPTFVAHVGWADGRARALALILCLNRKRRWLQKSPTNLENVGHPSRRFASSQPDLSATRLPPSQGFWAAKNAIVPPSELWIGGALLAAFIVRSSGSRIAYSSGGVTKDKAGGWTGFIGSVGSGAFSY